MNDFKRARVTTTVGELITALSEEACPFSKSERETSIVVGYIFNDLLVIKTQDIIVGEERREAGE